MNTLIALTGLVLLAAATPGPNNFAVLQIAAAEGLRRAVAAIAGIVGGSLVLALLAQLGVETLVMHHPQLARLLTICGSLYLAYGGLRLMQRRLDAALPASNFPASAVAVARSLGAFQFTNPKAWLLVVTVVAAVRARGGSQARELLTGVALLTLVPAVCLTAWALVGCGLRRATLSGQRNSWATRLLGLLLIASAAVLAVS